MTMPRVTRRGRREDDTHMIYIAADHAGYEAKNILRDALLKRGFAVTDLGAETFDKNDDYPLFSKKLARMVSKDIAHRGILLCGSGQGVCIVANKTRGVRAALAWNCETARASRNDDDANVLCIGARFISRTLALRIALEWLKTPFSKLARHTRRLHQIEKSKTPLR